MELNKNLKFTDKYNWWTKDEDKKGIDIVTKLSYVMTKGQSDELFFIFKNFDISHLKKAYKLVEKDWYSLKDRRKGAIQNLIKAKENNL